MKKMTLNRRVLVLMAGTFLVVFSLCFLLFAVTFYYREQEQVKQEIRETFHRLENRVDGYLGETEFLIVNPGHSRISVLIFFIMTGFLMAAGTSGF